MNDLNYNMIHHHDEYVNQKLILAGFKPNELTEDQKDIILQPSEAPENYACDGEVNPRQASLIWIQGMIRSGLTNEQIVKARNMNRV